MRYGQLVLTSLAALLIIACQQKQDKLPAYQAASYEPLAQMDTPPAETDPYATDPMVTSEDTNLAADTANDAPRTAPTRVQQTPVRTAPQADVAGGARTHTVTKGDTLYNLARQYYHDQAKWRDIWQANRTRVPNPDVLPVGSKLIIP